MFRTDLSAAHNISDLRELAKRRLPRWLFEFVDRGSEDEVALRANRAVFDHIRLTPRMLVDVSRRSAATVIFGRQQGMPVAVGPTGVGGLMWYRGELELARAARDAGVPFSLATGSITSIEQVAGEVGGSLWMQLYMWKDRSLSHQLVRRAAAAGFQALLLTADDAVASNREYNRRNGFAMPFRYNRRNTLDVLAHPRWMLGCLGRYMVTGGMPRYENFPEPLRRRITSEFGANADLRNDTLTWDDVKALRQLWPGKLLVKGILHPDDAEQAVAHGADGVVISNHGGRNFDAAPTSMEVLPAIVQAIGQKATIAVDSGFRRGTDVVKALALGADLVLLGRGPLFGAAAAGYDGAVRALQIYREEITRTMGQVGCNTVDEIRKAGIIDSTWSKQHA